MADLTPSWIASRLLAITLPTVILGVAFTRLSGIQTLDAQRQLDNAGQLLNGEVLEEPVTTAIHRKMSGSPRIVVLGNSFANTNIHLTALTSTLGLTLPDIARLSIPNTIGAHWYAMLKYRVFIDPYDPPDLIVITTDLQSALLNVPLSEGSHGNLASLAEPNDPVIEAKVGYTNYWWTTVQQNRDHLRRNAVLSVRDLSAKTVLGPLPDKKLRTRTNQAMDRVFHPSLVDPVLRRALMPVTVGNESTAIEIDGLPSAEDSFLPAIAELCYQHGARLVLVRNHESPAMPPNRGDRVPAGTKAAVREAIEPFGGLLIDLHTLPMVRDSFQNLDHMTDEGAKRFSRTLGHSLFELGVLDEPDRLVTAPDAVAPASSRGPGFEIAASRQSWTAVAAGGTALWTVNEAWPDRPATFRVRAVVEVLGESVPRVSVGAEAVAVRSLGGGRWMAEQVGAAPDPPWSVEIGAEDAVVVQGLALGTGSTPRYLVGDRADLLGPTLDLLGPPTLYDGELHWEPIELTAAGAPPAMPPRPIKKAPNRGAAFDARGIRFFSDFETRKFTPLFARCSPVRVLEDGVELPLPNVGCTEVRDLGEGRMCQSDKRVVFSAPDGTDPKRNGRRYALALDPARVCDGAVWLYPEDVVRIAVPAARLHDQRDPVSVVEIDAKLVSAKATSIAARVEVDGQVRGQGVMSKGEQGMRIVLQPPVGPTDSVVLVLSATPDTFALVTRAEFVAAAVPWDLRE